MAKRKTNKKQTVDIDQLPTADQKEVAKIIKQLVVSMTSIDFEKEQMKEIVKSVVEQHAVEGKMVKKLAQILYKQSLSADEKVFKKIQDTFSLLFGEGSEEE
jgi:hypothetical protein